MPGPPTNQLPPGVPTFPTQANTATYTLPSIQSIDILNPDVIKQYKPENKVRKGQFVVDDVVLTSGIIIPHTMKIKKAYIYLTSDFGENQFHFYYLTQIQKANIKAASNLLSTYVRTNPIPVITQWGSNFKISANVSYYDSITGYAGQSKKILFKFKNYGNNADGSDSDSGSDSGYGSN